MSPSRVVAVRFVMVAAGLTVGVLRDSNVLALVLGAVGYAIGPYLAHPRAAARARGDDQAHRRYLEELRTGYGEPVDLGSGAQRERALEGRISPFRVFVSSTFVDLSRERERLSTDLFPRMARECERRGAVWTPIDLRWGITDLQRDAGEVARICLDSVRSSLPNVIGIIGERYGTLVRDVDADRTTTDPRAGRSLTHLEMLEAITPDPAALSVFVLDRDRGPDDEHQVGEMVDGLRHAGARLHEGVQDDEQLVSAVEADLMRRLDEQFPGDASGNLLLREVSAHRRMDQRLAAQSIINASVLAEIDAAAAEGRIAVVRGRAGSGRSSLMSAWARSWRTLHPDDIVVCRFVGLTASSLTWPDLLRSIAGEVAMHAELDVRLPEDDNELTLAVARLFLQVQSQRRVVVSLDSPDRIRTPAGMEGGVVSRGLSWVPQTGPSTNLAFVPIVTFEEPSDFDRFAYPARYIEIPSLIYADRLTLLHDRLAAVDRALPSGTISNIVEHPCSGHPAFLALLANELHRTSTHEEISLALRRMLRVDSLDDLVATALERVVLQLDERQTTHLWSLLSVLVRPPAGLTEEEVVGLVHGICPDFGQSGWALLRDRLASILSEADGAWRVIPSLMPGVRRLVDTMEATADLDRSWAAYFGSDDRGCTPRSITMLRLLDDGALMMGEMRRLCEVPQGMVAFRTTFEHEFYTVLGDISTGTGRRAADMIDATVHALQDHDDLDTRLGLAEICVVHRLIGLCEVVLSEVPPEQLRADPRGADRWLALRAKASLRGGSPMPRDEWDRMLERGIARRSPNVHLALSGIGAGLAREGNLVWAKKYYARAFEIAFATGNLLGTATCGSNQALCDVADGPDSMLRQLSGPLRVLFDKSVNLSLASGDLEAAMATMFRRSVVDVYMGSTGSAAEGFEVVGSVAQDLDHQYYIRLASLGQAFVLAAQGKRQAAIELANGWDVALDSVEAILRHEVLELIV